MRKLIGLGIAVLVLGFTGWWTTRGLNPATPNPPGTFSFAVLGDAPYYVWEEIQFRLVMLSRCPEG